MKLWTKDVLSALKTPEEELGTIEDRIRMAQKEYGEVPDLALMAYKYFHVPYGDFAKALDKINKEVSDHG